MDIIETEKGKLFQEVFIDVTEREAHERQIQKRYLLEQNRAMKYNNGMLHTVCFDVLNQVVESTTIESESIKPGITIDKFIEALIPELGVLQSVEEMKEIRELFSYESMSEAFECGEFEDDFILCRRVNNEMQWLRSDLALCYSQTNGHLMCFAYIWDITDEQISGAIMRQMALADCDGFMGIDITTGHCMQYRRNEKNELDRVSAVYGKNDSITNMADMMEEPKKSELLKVISLDNVKKQLSGNQYYQTYATLKNYKGARIDKAITFFFIDDCNGLLAATVSDVTEVKRSEVRQAQLLSDALSSAEKAGAAKGEFLSRVSHEMRTPLNAIIGFIELAKGASNEDKENYLASSDIAAKQLLNVINDVLDMSSIESGKIKIASAPFNFKSMITSITNIYGVQCKQKDISFEVVMKSVTEDWLVGDELRVNQILINLLGNAVKFTKEGIIRLAISQTTISEDKFIFRFEVSDTGCGMSEQMKERLFKPFEQESSSTARKYGGSGLGLSIVKNLVSMMDGIIKVETEQDRGTKFIVDIPFLKSKTGNKSVISESIGALRVLAVDDEEAEREYLSLMLERMGVRYTCVSDGTDAITELERAERDNDQFNICLVDWHMPKMNGEETTKLIRNKYGSDVIVIVVSAYDYQQAGEKAKKAGANMFLSKPVFQSSLFNMFMTLTDGKTAKPSEETQSWDFAGKRVLLVEDNALNQIVAKGYLAKFNVVVDLAVNGKEGADAFVNSAPGTYDAILMDIQMPVMDGFEATREIRSSAHPEAKTIQIIAQTADAFNEDITKALSCGMNAHVAKPIKPEMLANALAKAFSRNKKGVGNI